MQAKWGDWGPQTRHFSANFWTISQSILGRVLAQVKTRTQFTILVTTLDCHFLLFVWERVWAVQLDLCASTCSVPGLPRAIPNISLAETAVPTDKIHFFHIQRTRRHPQTLNQAMHFYYPTCISQEYWSRCFLFIFKQKDVKWFPFMLKR